MIRRGEIWLVDWNPARGSEQAGLRPALVIQNDIGNEHSPTTIVAALSTKAKRPYPFHVLLTREETGLHEDSVVKLEQIMTVDKARLVRRLGVVPSNRMVDVSRAIHHSLHLTECGGVS